MLSSFCKSAIIAGIKESILDVKAATNDGRLLNIELQVIGSNLYRKRIAYYLCSLYRLIYRGN
ncbi:MAG: PD-(D/E)XK nuclease family transposase [Spirochaetales bacterium]|nr:PD-(D/E)XK nuclease family transposase [Spirochaetales bacterium]